MRTLSCVRFPGLTAWLLLALVLGPRPARADDWPQWLGPQRDGVWRETGILERLPDNGPQVRWRTPIGAGYAGPAVAAGRVFVTARQVAPRASAPASPFERGTIPGTEQVLCLKESDGTRLWKHEYNCPYAVSYPAGPRATPVVDGPRVFTLGTEGNLFCLDVATGEVVWSREFKKEFGMDSPMWGFAGHPLVDGRKLICLAGGEGSVAVAFDKVTGKELWRALNAREPGYCPPMIYEVGGRRQLIVWHPESVNGLDPETGRVLWTQRFPVRAGLSVPTPRLRGDRLFITSFYEGPLLLRLTDDPPTVLWRGKGKNERNTDGLHSIISTPWFDEGHIYGVCSYGQLRCLRADTGERVWSTLAATTADGKETRWANAFLVRHGDRFFLPNEKGDLILARLTPEGYEEISRARLLEPTNRDPGREVVWSHPAFANRCIYARNDREIVCASLAAGDEAQIGQGR